MRRRLSLLVMSFILAFPVVLASAAPVAAYTDDCTDEGINYMFAGNYSDPAGTVQVDGVSAAINPTDSGFSLCSESYSLWGDNLSAWISLNPSRDSPYYGSATAILQIGIVTCNSNQAYCDGTNNVHFFWAYGGCNGASPTGRSLGDADYSAHSYVIQKKTISGGVYWVGYIDGYEKFRIGVSHSGVSCWINHSSGTRAGWYGEMHDGGNSYGHQGDWSNYLHFTSMSRRWDGGSWTNVVNTSTTCTVPAEDADNNNHTCTRELDGNRFWLYSSG